MIDGVKQATSDAFASFVSFAPIVGISAVFSIIRNIVSKNKTTIKDYCVSTIIAVPVGFVAGKVCHDFGLPDGSTWLVVSISSLLSNDIVVGIRKIGDEFAKDPEKVINKFRK